jgi:hypothetical protein
MTFAHRTLAPLAAGCCAITIAACGSSSNTGTNTGPGGAPKFSQNAALQFVQCMRTHGVPNMPDPSTHGGGIQFSAGSGLNPGAPAFENAQKQCNHFLPGLKGSPQGDAQRHQMLVKLAECMRKHGIASFPDPTNSPPSGGPPAGAGVAFGGPGGFLAISQTTMNSPGFQQAASACGFPGFGGKGLRPRAL